MCELSPVCHVTCLDVSLDGIEDFIESEDDASDGESEPGLGFEENQNGSVGFIGSLELEEPASPLREIEARIEEIEARIQEIDARFEQIMETRALRERAERERIQWRQNPLEEPAESQSQEVASTTEEVKEDLEAKFAESRPSMSRVLPIAILVNTLGLIYMGLSAVFSGSE